jgi:hypothetical protein
MYNFKDKIARATHPRSQISRGGMSSSSRCLRLWQGLRFEVLMGTPLTWGFGVSMGHHCG